MSILVRFPLSNVSREQYDSVRSALEDAGDWPADGCQIHVVSGDSSNIGVSEIWESREKFEAFGEKLGPRLGEANIQLAGEPEVSEAQIVDTY